MRAVEIDHIAGDGPVFRLSRAPSLAGLAGIAAGRAVRSAPADCRVGEGIHQQYGSSVTLPSRPNSGTVPTIGWGTRVQKAVADVYMFGNVRK